MNYMDKLPKIVSIAVLPYAIFGLHLWLLPGSIAPVFAFKLGRVLFPAAMLLHLIGVLVLFKIKGTRKIIIVALISAYPLLTMVTVAPYLLCVFISEYSSWGVRP